MAMPSLPAQRDWTVDDLHALPDDGNRYELIDGELFVSPSPNRPHQRALRELLLQLEPYVRSLGGVEVLFAPYGVTWSTRTEVQPDLLVMPITDRVPSGAAGDRPELELVVEILSPSTARVDRYRKRALYQRERVPEYWIVDVTARLVERWRPNDEEPEIIFEHFAWQPRGEVAPLIIDLAEIFRIANAGEGR